jgi:chromosome segregation protein
LFLKSLTLKGFKSFADHTTLEFEPGITVVVGPNGSGKSNIVDAVAWVLGAQGPRSLRSTKMEDVIFAGTPSRPALGRAEVTLTIDNSAGLLPIEFAEVSITRTLFRSGESEYAINGVPCRLLDIQELLSDTGVGRQQHVIVSQGQLDSILNARPEDRRLMIEEAAGVLKYRKRREKAQRRLEATEANFLRLQDFLREVRRQLRPLERQAEAARRHGDLVAELAAVRLYVAGRELAALRGRRDAGRARLTGLVEEERTLRADLTRLDTDVAATEQSLSAQGGDDLGDTLTRYEALRERARGLAAVLAERRRGLERDRRAMVDAGVIATLEAEAARLRGELAEVEAEAQALLPRADELAGAEAALARARADYEEAWGDTTVAAPVPGGEAAEVRGELGALRTAVERSRGEVARLEAHLASLGQKGERLAVEADRLRGEIALAADAERGLVEAAETAEIRRQRGEAELAEAEASLRAADSDRHAWEARAEALALALDDARAHAGAERLADVEGVLGTLLDLVDVDEAGEPAVEAAAGEALAAVVVDGVASARAAFACLHDQDAAGAVLTLGLRREPVLPWQVGEPVRAHVRGTVPAVEHLLDALLGSAVAVDGGWQDALDVVLAHPGAIAVTRRGDRFSPTGWRAGAAGPGATRAALDEARRRAEEAAADTVAAEQRAAAARAELTGARAAEADAMRVLDENDTRRAAATDALARVEAEGRDVAVEDDALRAHLGELAERVERDEARVADLERRLPALEAEEHARAERAGAMRQVQVRLEEQAAAVGALRTDLEVRAAGLQEREGFLTRRLTEVDERLSRNLAERDAAESRRVDLDRQWAAVEALAGFVGDRLGVVEAELATLRERRRRQSEAARRTAEHLDALRRERAEAERRLEEVREQARRAELDEAEVRMRIEASVEAIRREFDCEPGVAIEAACPSLPPGTSPESRVRELERELRLLGPVNALALEEMASLKERHDFLEGQLEDVKATRRELTKVIKAVDAEIVQVFGAAYADVAENFTALFATLFPGGQGRLRLTDPDNPLETGVEVEARPSGKNVRKLSLLSGGERSLTALAFLFAIFRSRPSPFYLLDEVEAALDDVNLHRFLDLLHEFREEAQLLVVSHQKRTMEAADCLYGVTMQPGGSSRVVSERVATRA